MSEALIQLTTYDDSEPLELDSRDVAFIVDQLAGRIAIRREIARERYRLNSGAYAGLIRLPSGTLIRSTPRIPTQNIFRMLAVAHGIPSLTWPDTIELADLDQLLEFVVEYFADRLEERIEQGLYRAYVEIE